jgi:asparaginyl-tRNA synthetase
LLIFFPSAQFFGRPTYLTVSGQLYAEMLACSLSRVYTFSPTFRAEHSQTVRHLNEFWMIEPELAFAGLEDVMQLAEKMVKRVIGKVVEVGGKGEWERKWSAAL